MESSANAEYLTYGEQGRVSPPPIGAPAMTYHPGTSELSVIMHTHTHTYLQRVLLTSVIVSLSLDVLHVLITHRKHSHLLFPSPHSFPVSLSGCQKEPQLFSCSVCSLSLSVSAGLECASTTPACTPQFSPPRYLHVHTHTLLSLSSRPTEIFNRRKHDSREWGQQTQF